MAPKPSGSKARGTTMKRPSASKKAASANAAIADDVDDTQRFIQRATSGCFSELELDRLKAKFVQCN